MLIFGNMLFDAPLQTITAFNAEQFRAAFLLLEKLRHDYFIAGYVRYEAKNIFYEDSAIQSSLPLLYFEVFSEYKKYKESAAAPIYLDVKAKIGFDEYKNAIDKIKNEIKNGNTYEVNWTHDFTVNAGDANAVEVYNYLLPKQRTPYNAFITNRWESVLSFSPELFFSIEEEGGVERIVTKPMKGTIRRGRNEEEDTALKQFLMNDEKNRAENVMIVDLLRNDLGRIARFGTVRVRQLFEIETHPTLHQMTSRIEAELNPKTTLYEQFKALFPCGSVTGAPKLSTMNIIEKTESGPRGVYCGAIGLLTPRGHGKRRALWSVPIRILQKTFNEEHWRYRSGGAIVWDSNAEDEYKETLVKARFLQNDFYLLETMKSQNLKIEFFKEHLFRLKKSAAYFDFIYNETLENIKPDKDGILRLLLKKNGEYKIEYRPLVESAKNYVRLSNIKVDSSDIFLYHKTTYRPLFNLTYDDYYDELFCNERGELTEGSRSNIVVELEKKLYTPPLSCGLLDGIMRRQLLNHGECAERILYPRDLEKASKIFCVNSVRGIKEVRFV
ncbi:MAG: bifunctional anthranilate synthase component I family protein/aminotransferase class IV [Termitinemataceae bacterium]|nr:MAG: bifunctional anthranilate synthase component I family protein/aminotransferase class IV [Termitinemataceae bacterium]